jgi:hypothetical protein
VGSLSGFDGVDLFGDWTLTFSDNTIWPNEGDDLTAWSLYGTTIPEPASIGLLGLVSCGIFFTRRFFPAV